MGTPAAPPVADLLHGREPVQAAWRAAVQSLSDVPQTLLWVDADFTHWPLSEQPLLDRLTRWLRPPGHRLQMLGLDFAATERAHPRFARWRRDWLHHLAFLRPVEPVPGTWPSLMLHGTVAVQLLDAAHWRARVLDQPVALREMQQQIDALAQRCEAAWPLAPLGL